MLQNLKLFKAPVCGKFLSIFVLWTKLLKILYRAGGVAQVLA
jgi:hypothetical protein